MNFLSNVSQVGQQKEIFWIFDRQWDPVFEVIGWTLIHFVWQAILIGMFVWVALLATRKCSSNTRYLLCLLYTSPSPRDKRQSRMPSSA